MNANDLRPALNIDLQRMQVRANTETHLAAVAAACGSALLLLDAEPGDD